MSDKVFFPVPDFTVHGGFDADDKAEYDRVRTSLHDNYSWAFYYYEDNYTPAGPGAGQPYPYPPIEVTTDDELILKSYDENLLKRVLQESLIRSYYLDENRFSPLNEFVTLFKFSIKGLIVSEPWLIYDEVKNLHKGILDEFEMILKLEGIDPSEYCENDEDDDE